MIKLETPAPATTRDSVVDGSAARMQVGYCLLFVLVVGFIQSSFSGTVATFSSDLIQDKQKSDPPLLNTQSCLFFFTDLNLVPVQCLKTWIYQGGKKHRVRRVKIILNKERGILNVFYANSNYFDFLFFKLL